MAPSPHRSYWRQTSQITVALLAAWMLLTLGVALWAPDLQFSFFDWPFGFWAAAQGALLLYCAIVWVYAFWMDRVDAAHQGDDPD